MVRPIMRDPLFLAQKLERHIAKKARRGSSKNHLKGSRKRTAEDDKRFAESFEKLLCKVMS